MRRSLLLPGLLALAALAPAAPLRAQGVLVAPHTIFIDHRARSGSISLYNPGNDPVEIELKIFFAYVVSDSAGQFELRSVETPDSTMPSAAGWLQTFPRIVTLAGRETQTVRLLARPPANLPDGEYWARLMVSARNQPPAATAPTDSTGVSVGLDLEVRTVLPMLYRKGTVSTGVRVDSLTLTRVQGDSLELRAHLTRTGNAAYIGQVRAAVVDSAGTVVASNKSPIAVYYEMTPRIRMACGALPPGRYRLRFELATERDDLTAPSLLQSPLVRDSVEVRLP